MSCRKTAYNKIWEREFSWIGPVKDDRYSAYCKLCLRSFRIDCSGFSQAKSHQKSNCHKSAVSKSNSQQSLAYLTES